MRYDRLAVTLLVCAGAFVLAACQSSETQPPAPSAPAASSEGSAAPSDRRGAPDPDIPAAVQGLIDTTRETALRWQDEPVPAELSVAVQDGVVTSAEVTWLAGDADRLEIVRLDADGVSDQRPTLATVGALPVSAEGLALVPAPPDDLLGPVALVEASADALGACGTDAGDGALDVTYATGAPFDWDGTSFDVPPSWSATVGVERPAGGMVGARVDPASGSGSDDCFEVAAQEGG